CAYKILHNCILLESSYWALIRNCALKFSTRSVVQGTTASIQHAQVQTVRNFKKTLYDQNSFHKKFQQYAC
ncbi:MAG: hypothetical protein MJE68_21975, partial [Proteobacteria bacterium]|nr:hypothetical protein [Pseudomonadota bacterium]